MTNPNPPTALDVVKTLKAYTNREGVWPEQAALALTMFVQGCVHAELEAIDARVEIDSRIAASRSDQPLGAMPEPAAWRAAPIDGVYGYWDDAEADAAKDWAHANNTAAEPLYAASTIRSQAERIAARWIARDLRARSANPTPTGGKA